MRRRNAGNVSNASASCFMTLSSLFLAEMITGHGLFNVGLNGSNWPPGVSQRSNFLLSIGLLFLLPNNSKVGADGLGCTPIQLRMVFCKFFNQEDGQRFLDRPCQIGRAHV